MSAEGAVGTSPASNGKRPSPGRPHLDAGRLALIRVPAATFAPRHGGTCSPTARGAVTSSRSATLGAWESGAPWGLEEAVLQCWWRCAHRAPVPTVPPAHQVPGDPGRVLQWNYVVLDPLALLARLRCCAGSLSISRSFPVDG